ncbi:secreted RxLR effector protein 161-like [Phaseolus vulgaris]|uniref:secreted RxLR effector protein 161-like n=1 Tax=Phaseolus vulgaris TaxID=3885 RepID=UPI0035CC8E22
MAKVPYANAVGSLVYAMMCTRPDISQTVSVVSRYMHNPSKAHWQDVRWILRYLQNTLDVGLTFEQDESLAKNQVFHARTKHIDVRYHFVREILDEGEIVL